MFSRVARGRVLGTADFSVGDGAFVRVAKAAQLQPTSGPRLAPSYYLDGARTIPVTDKLARVAEAYAISANPADYLWEAIRANTTNPPNENHDGFHQLELLRYATRLGMPVYETYTGKPHHVDHRTSNPKAARGFIVDTHYNDTGAVLEVCPRCTRHTANRANRDVTGLHCKCGQLVRDEFVEILVGVDTRKDAAFAEGVRTGQLDAGSMGCNCLSTLCNVCAHVAYARPEFCEHIRGGAKGGLYLRDGTKWNKTSAVELARAFKRIGYRWDPEDFCYVTHLDSQGRVDFEARKAFEYCQDIVFEEYSRVRQPADRKARQREVFSMRARAHQRSGSYSPRISYLPSARELAAETQDLIRGAAAARAVAARTDLMPRSAQTHPDDASGSSTSTNPAEASTSVWFVVEVDGDPGDRHAGPTLEEALAEAGLEGSADAQVRSCEVEAPDVHTALGLFDDAQASDVPLGHDADVTVQAPPNEAIVIQPPGGPAGAPGTPGAPGAPGMSIDDLNDQQRAPNVPPPGPGGPGGGPGGNPQLTPADMGMAPPGASRRAPRAATTATTTATTGRPTTMKYRSAYRDWSVEVSPQGTARVFNAANVPVLLIRGAAEPDDQRRYARAHALMTAICTDGLTRTAQMHKAIMSPRIAQVVDGAIDDMKEFADKYMHDSVLDDAEDDMQGERNAPPDHVPSDMDDDMDGDVRGPPLDSSQDGGEVDHEEGPPDGVDSVTQEDNTDMRDTGRSPVSLGSDSVLDNETHDHVEPLHGGKKRSSAPAPRAPAAAPRTAPVLAALTAVGARIAHASRPDVAWTVRQAALAADGTTQVVVATEGTAPRRVGQKDLMAYWRSLDATPTGTPSIPVPRAGRQAGVPAASIQPTLATRPQAETRTAEARLKAAWATREAKLKDAHTRELADVRTATLQSFCRAMRIAARRQDVGLEGSPFRMTAEQVLTTPHGLGPMGVPYAGMAPELARYLVAEATVAGGTPQLEGLMARAADLMSKGDTFLLDAESDAQHYQAALPPITAAHVSPQDEVTMAAMQMRQAAINGNFALTPMPSDMSGPQNGSNGYDKRSAIANAVQGTMVSTTLGRIRQN